MSENKKLMNTYVIDYMCDKCEIGNVLPIGLCYDTYPPIFPHKCNHCGEGYSFNFTYPTNQYRAEDGV